MKQNLVIIDNYLDDDIANELHNNISKLSFTPIKLDGEVTYEFGYSMSDDIEKHFGTPVFFNLVNSKLDTTANAIHNAHISVMTKGDSIGMHHDKTADGQCVTFLYYLTDTWDYTDGGLLEISDSISILPVFNRLVIFNNVNFPHYVSVINTDNDRYTITGWLTDDRHKNNN